MMNQIPNDTPDVVSPPALGTTTVAPVNRVRLITNPRYDKPRFTANQTTDVHTALTKGLADYLEPVQFDAHGGRPIGFRSAFNTWAEPEDEADYPAVIVYGPEPGKYDASKLNPDDSNLGERIALPDGRYLSSPAEYTQDLHVEVWCTDSEERKNAVIMTEAALTASTFMYGVRLELPHYFNQRATYELMSMGYLDDQDHAIQRVRIARFIVRACVPLTRLLTISPAQIRIQDSVTAYGVTTTTPE